MARMPYSAASDCCSSIFTCRFHPASVFIGKFIEKRRDHFAGAAPFRPKINEHGHRRLQNLLRKTFLCERDD